MCIKLNKELHQEICKNNNEYVNIKMIEELSELIKCISNKYIDIDNLSEEICDVFIYLYRFRSILDIKLNIKPNRNIVYTNLRIINILSSFSQIMSKYCLYDKIDNNKLAKYMTDVYTCLNILMEEYDIHDKVQKWISKKEQRDRELLDKGIKYYPKKL